MESLPTQLLHNIIKKSKKLIPRLVCKTFAMVPLQFEYGTIYLGCGVFKITTGNYKKIPRDAKLLIMSKSFNESLTIKTPITSLIMGRLFYKKLELPKSLVYLKTHGRTMGMPEALIHLDNGSDKWGVEEYPDSLKHLSINRSHTGLLTRVPTGLTHLTLNGDSHELILPETLTHLSFSGVSKLTLPSSLTHLNVGVFDPDLLVPPNSLTHLTMSCCRGTKICIPSLRKLVIEELSDDIDLSQLTLLESLRIEETPYPGQIIFPDNLKRFFINCTEPDIFNDLVLPTSLERIEINCTEEEVTYCGDLLVDKTYKSLKTIIFGPHVNIPLYELPDSLEVLKLHENYKFPIPPLPKSLTTISLTKKFPLSANMPETIINILIGESFSEGLSKMCQPLQKIVIDSVRQKYSQFNIIIEDKQTSDD